MIGFNVSEKVRHLFEGFFTVLLFVVQTTISAGLFMGIMAIPLLPYIWKMISRADANFASRLSYNVTLMLFAEEFWIGKIIALVGVIILFVALSQLLRNRRKGVELIESGAYSWVRHPQFTGIIVITFGLSVIVATMGHYFAYTRFEVMSYWLLQVLGYIAIAKFEEWRLIKKLGDRFTRYKENVPFLFPVKSPWKIPELLFTVLIVILFWIVLLYFPFPPLPQFPYR
jgi:protein-S-isoprenylcysteine O-methyltransferase Ste14